MTDITDRLPMPDLPGTAERVRLRELFNTTQAEVGRHIGVSRQMVNRYERGRSVPTGTVRDKYAALLSSWAESERRILARLETDRDSIEAELSVRDNQ